MKQNDRVYGIIWIRTGSLWSLLSHTSNFECLRSAFLIDLRTLKFDRHHLPRRVGHLRSRRLKGSPVLHCKLYNVNFRNW